MDSAIQIHDSGYSGVMFAFRRVAGIASVCRFLCQFGFYLLFQAQITGFLPPLFFFSFLVRFGSLFESHLSKKEKKIFVIVCALPSPPHGERYINDFNDAYLAVTRNARVVRLWPVDMGRLTRTTDDKCSLFQLSVRVCAGWVVVRRARCTNADVIIKWFSLFSETNNATDQMNCVSGAPR